MPPREPWRLEDGDAELKLREEKLRERMKELDHLEEKVRKQRNKYRVEMEEKVANHRHKRLIKDEELSLLEIDLYRRELDVAAWEEEVQDRVREAELQRRKRELKFRNDATERQARALASELKKPLLQTRPEAEKKDKEDDTWNKRQNYATMALVTGLTILFQIRFDLPPDHLTLILRSFAVLWLLGSVIFPSGLVGTHKLEVEFSRHVGRLTFMCLSLLVLYALYLMLLPGHGTSLHTCPPRSAVTSPPPSAVTPSREVQSNLGFFIALGVLEIIRHIAFWVMDGVKEPK